MSLQEKAQRAIARLGERWVLHPANAPKKAQPPVPAFLERRPANA